MADPTGKTILGISKSTASGILTGMIGTFSAIMTFQVPSAMLTPQASHLWLYITTGANAATIILKVWLGVLENDAPAS